MSLNCPGSVYYLASHVNVLSKMKVDLGNSQTKATDKDLYGFTPVSRLFFE